MVLQQVPNSDCMSLCCDLEGFAGVGVGRWSRGVVFWQGPTPDNMSIYYVLVFI